MQRNERAGQRSGSLAALQWSGMEAAGIGGVRLPPRRQSAVLKRRPSPLARVTVAAKPQSDAVASRYRQIICSDILRITKARHYFMIFGRFAPGLGASYYTNQLGAEKLTATP
jgi:hypothetical protein